MPLPGALSELLLPALTGMLRLWDDGAISMHATHTPVNVTIADDMLVMSDMQVHSGNVQW